MQPRRPEMSSEQTQPPQTPPRGAVGTARRQQCRAPDDSSADTSEGWAIVRRHNEADSCWIVIDGRVLDCTQYLGHHPGGARVIERLGGKDATTAYRAAHHSRAADMKLRDYDVGALTNVARLQRAATAAAQYRDRLRIISQYLE